MNKNIQPGVCPYCGKPVSAKLRRKYLWQDTDYQIECNHCHHPLLLVREGMSMTLVSFLNGLALLVPCCLGIYVFHLGYLLSVLCSLPVWALVICLTFYIYQKNLYFQ